MSRRPLSAPRRGAISAWAAVVIAGVYVTATVSTGRGTPFGDFDKAYYPAGQLAVANPSALYECGHADGLCFVNMPIVALAFVPVSALSRPAAHWVMTVTGVASVALTIAMLIALAGASGWSRFAVATLVLLNGPLYYSLRLANLTHVVLVILLAALLALRRDRQMLGGGLLAACALLKPPFLIWLPYLALRQRSRRAAGWFAATLTLTVVASLLWFGVGLHRTWFTEYVGGASTRPVGAYNAQSISGMLIRLTTSAHLVDWTGVDMSPALRGTDLALSLSVVGVVFAALWRARSPASPPASLAEYSLVLSAMLLISPISWTHYYCVLLVPLAAWVSRSFSLGAPPTLDAAFGIGALLVSLPVALWIPGHPVFGPLIARLLLSHYVAGCAVLLCMLAFWLARSASQFTVPYGGRRLMSQWNADAI